MPGETPGPPEYTLQPEFWDGHSLEDDCLWEVAESSASNIISNIRADRREATVKSEIRALMAHRNVIAESTSIKSFVEKGDVFDASAYPMGTAVRIQQESLRDTVWGPVGRRYSWETTVGLIVDFGTADDPHIQVASYPISPEGTLNFRSYLRRRGPKIALRDVEHYRMRFHVPGGGRPSNSLNRFTRVEILELGEPQTEQARGRSFLGRFLPNTS